MSMTMNMKVNMDTEHIAYLGLGGMGAGMAQRLLDTGFRLTVYNRTPQKAEALVAAGAQLGASPAEAVKNTSIVILSLSDEDAIDMVLFGPEGAHQTIKPGTLVIDTSTTSPSYARTVANRLAVLGAQRIEACVIGNPKQARSGELRIFTAGDTKAAETVRAILATLGRQVTHLGATGNAATMKLVFNVLLGPQLAALAEAVSYGEQAGLDRQSILAAIAASGFCSQVMAFRCGFMQQENYEPAAFRTRLMEKDLRLALTEAASYGINMPVIATSAQRFEAAIEAGLGDLDAAVILVQQMRDHGIPLAMAAAIAEE
jgi:3-hydroxyisobutyrate dehydrogenase-like beta-hydroxyacid dehydrogenase